MVVGVALYRVQICLYTCLADINVVLKPVDGKVRRRFMAKLPFTKLLFQPPQKFRAFDLPSFSESNDFSVISSQFTKMSTRFALSGPLKGIAAQNK